MLSVLILSAFIIFSLIILPALAEIQLRRRDEQPPEEHDDVRQDEDPGELVIAA